MITMACSSHFGHVGRDGSEAGDSKVDAKQPAQMGAEHRYDEAAPAKITGHKSQQPRHDRRRSPYVGPVEAKTAVHRRAASAAIRCGSNGMITAGSAAVFTRGRWTVGIARWESQSLR